MDLPSLVALAPIAFAGSVLYGLTGFGSALITVPLASHFLPLPFVLATFAVVDLVNAIRVTLERPRDAVKSEVVRMVPLIVLGVVLGVTLLVNLPRQAAMVALGVFVASYAAYTLLRRGQTRVVSQNWAYVAGLAGGTTGTLFGAGGPPYAIYLSQRGLGNRAFRSTLTMTSVFSIGLRAAAFAVTGLFAQAGFFPAVAIAVPSALVGLAVSSRLFVRMSRETLARVIALVLLATGLSLIVRAVA